MSLADQLVLKPEFNVRRGRMEAMDQAVEKIEIAFPGVEKRAPMDIQIILKKVETALEKGVWEGVSSGDVSLAVYAELAGELTLSQGLRNFLDNELRATTNPTLIDALCRGYLISWDMGSARTRDLSALIVQKAPNLPDRWKSLFSECPDFLDAEKGCDAVGQRMVDVATPFSWLKGIGLPSPHEEGFMLQAHNAFLRHTPEPKTEQEIDKLLTWASPPNQLELFDARAVDVVEKILSPWLSVDCPQNLMEHSVERLVKRFGDPRNEHQAFWSQVGSPHRRVIFKWLARKSMEAIFEIVSRSERGADQGHQWVKRKRFWIGLYDKGRIDEAWVVLGKKAVPFAKALYEQTGDPSFQSYGRQEGRNDTCLLLVKLGDKTIVEGSHSFRVHVFPTPSRTTPVLYARNYDLDDILLPMGHRDARMHDSGGNWMRWVQRRISR